MEELNGRAQHAWETLLEWVQRPEFWFQWIAIVSSVIVAYILATILRSRFKFFHEPPTPGLMYGLRAWLFEFRAILFPIFCVIMLGIASEISSEVIGKNWLVKILQGLSVIFLIYSYINHFIKNPIVITLTTWVGIPVAVLYVFGWLDDVTGYLDGIKIAVGNIKLSAFDLIRTAFFGVILFWLGRFSNDTGKRMIRSQPALDIGTREVIAKLFEIGLYVVIFLVLLQVMGINLTTLAVFGGALGVGLGFGLQQIAANFISGLIILLDRSITIGDYIELEDGRGGTIRELSMRNAILETFDGKDIMVPNEQFVTTAFTNWTHNNKKQRYPIEFQVAYATDLPKLFEILREVVASHPKVLSGDDVPIAERPDAEIASFGDSGIDILIEFWMEGIDDGENRVGADLLLMIWTALQQHGIEIPFPQREIKLLGEEQG